jgi:hypothetical protein
LPLFQTDGQRNRIKAKPQLVLLDVSSDVGIPDEINRSTGQPQNKHQRPNEDREESNEQNEFDSILNKSSLQPRVPLGFGFIQMISEKCAEHPADETEEANNEINGDEECHWLPKLSLVWQIAI